MVHGSKKAIKRSERNGSKLTRIKNARKARRERKTRKFDTGE